MSFAVDGYEKIENLDQRDTPYSGTGVTVTPPEGFTYTPDQERVMRAVIEPTINDGGIGIMAGYAGTGKSTILAHVVDAMDKAGVIYNVVCPTGRAAARLRAAGVSTASTIHSWLYIPIQTPEGELVGFKKREDMDLPPRFVLVVDEASMISPQVFDDMVSVLMPRHPGRSMIIVGDDFQLPPVMSRAERSRWGNDYCALNEGGARMYAPRKTRKGTLRDVVRQGADNPVLRLATALRNKELPPIQIDKRLTVLRQGRGWIADEVAKTPLKDSRVYLTWTNRDRRALNEVARQSLGFNTCEIAPGERLIVTMNNRELNVCNGDLIDVDFVDEYGSFQGRMIHDIEFRDPFGVRKDAKVLLTHATDGVKGNPSTSMLAKMIADDPNFGFKPLLIDYGYCLTCHKAQGSEWDEVVTYAPDALQKYLHGDESTRWLYTAITRTRNTLTFAGGSRLAQILGA